MVKNLLQNYYLNLGENVKIKEKLSLRYNGKEPTVAVLLTKTKYVHGEPIIEFLRDKDISEILRAYCKNNDLSYDGFNYITSINSVGTYNREHLLRLEGIDLSCHEIHNTLTKR